MWRLFYLAEPKFGGWATFTAHLAHSLAQQGHQVHLCRVGSRTENKLRPWGRGLQYQNIGPSALEAMSHSANVIVTAADKKGAPHARALVERGAALVIHDPTELHAPMVEALKAAQGPVIVIREANIESVGKVLGRKPTFIRHPYVSSTVPTHWTKRNVNAVSISRIDWDKHTDIIAQANELLIPDTKVHIRGALNRLYAHHKLDVKVPGWRAMYEGGFPATDLHAGVRVACKARYMVDMSAIVGDGGGTQYTFLEAWDAKAALVVNRAWLRPGSEDDIREGVNALVVADHQELANVLKKRVPRDVVDGGTASLKAHFPGNIVPAYEKLFR